VGVSRLWQVTRKVLLWAVPCVLIAALAWTFRPPSPGATSGADISAPAPPPSRGAADEPSRPADLPSGRDRAGSKPYAQIYQGDLEGTDDSGRQHWHLVAEDVTVDQGKELVILRKVHATMSTADGTTLAITGDEGRYNTVSREVEVTGRVHGTSSNGRELFADRLRWTPATSIVTGSGNVRLAEQHVVMYADRVVSNIALGQTQFFGHVHVAAR
jgi:LPS export ABC transporter protein LptC